MTHQDSSSERKQCRRCKEVMPLSAFTKDRNRDDGHAIYCPPCNKLNCLASYIKRRDKQLAKNKEYRRTPAGKATAIRYSYKALSKDPEKAEARWKLRYAVKTGRVHKFPCEVCGDTKVQAHHHLGYEPDHWYDVQWLCNMHHRDVHRFSLRSRGIAI